MRTDEKVAKQLARFETVEWLYDGLGGKIIGWTKSNGGTSDDQSCQAFVVKRDGTVLSRCPDASAHAAGGFEKWLKEQADAYERENPRTQMPFVLTDVKASGEGEEKKFTCASLGEARAAKRPVLLYFGREGAPEADKALKAQVTAARKFEKGVLDSKAAADAASGWVLLRLDLSDDDHVAFAKTLGVSGAPTLLLFAADAEKPEDLSKGLTAPSLAFQLGKHPPSR